MKAAEDQQRGRTGQRGEAEPQHDHRQPGQLVDRGENLRAVLAAQSDRCAAFRAASVPRQRTQVVPALEAGERCTWIRLLGVGVGHVRRLRRLRRPGTVFNETQ